MQKKRICHISTVHPPFDTRIFQKECKTLVRAGYEVTLIVQHGKDEIVQGVRIKALPRAKNHVHRMFGLTFKALRLALKQKSDVYHVHDPELLPIGLILKLLTRKKIIYDVHEDYYLAVQNKEWLPKLIRSYASLGINIIERFSTKVLDQIIAVTPDIAKKFPISKTVIIRNVPILEMIEQASPLIIKKERSVLIYVGSLSKIRGIKEVINAVGLLEGKVELWLLGIWESNQFKDECLMLRGWQFVKYFGYINNDDIYSYIKAADAGIHCPYPLPRYLVGLPTKHLEYLACSIPAILSSSDYWKSLFHSCALFVNPKSPVDIAEKILKIIDDNKLRATLSNHGRMLIERYYNWEEESKLLLNDY